MRISSPDAIKPGTNPRASASERHSVAARATVDKHIVAESRRAPSVRSEVLEGWVRSANRAFDDLGWASSSVDDNYAIAQLLASIGRTEDNLNEELGLLEMYLSWGVGYEGDVEDARYSVEESLKALHTDLVEEYLQKILAIDPEFDIPPEFRHITDG